LSLVALQILNATARKVRHINVKFPAVSQNSPGFLQRLPSLGSIEMFKHLAGVDYIEGFICERKKRPVCDNIDFLKGT